MLKDGVDSPSMASGGNNNLNWMLEDVLSEVQSAVGLDSEREMQDTMESENIT